jgi:hypothetical protein
LTNEPCPLHLSVGEIVEIAVAAAIATAVPASEPVAASAVPRTLASWLKMM